MDEEDELDPIAAMEARMEALRARAREGIPARLRAIREVFGRHGTEGEAFDELRRLAHQLRGVAEDEPLRRAAEAVELAAAGREPSLAEAVDALLAHASSSNGSTAAGSAAAGSAAVGASAVGASPVRASAVGASAVEGTSTGGVAALRRLRVLVVDDTESLRKLNRLALERMGGHLVDEASGPDEALAAATRTRYDVVLLDAMMPGGTGMDACLALRAHLPPHAKLVILSAASEAQLAPSGHQADAWWQKPISPKVLLERLAALVDA